MSQAWDNFFYYGLGDINDENDQDLLNGIVTKKQKLFYNRSDSAGLNDFENYPQGLAIQVGLRYSIVAWIAYRNTYIGDGVNSKERRVATSQEQVTIEQTRGNNDVTVLYIPFANYNKALSLVVPIQGA